MYDNFIQTFLNNVFSSPISSPESQTRHPGPSSPQFQGSARREHSTFIFLRMLCFWCLCFPVLRLGDLFCDKYDMVHTRVHVRGFSASVLHSRWMPHMVNSCFHAYRVRFQWSMVGICTHSVHVSYMFDSLHQLYVLMKHI
jgi:hypothetical protein